jgi:hypothetical protein
MSQGDRKSPRPWREIAAQASTETDSEKLSELVEELAGAFDAEDNRRKDNIRPAEQANEKKAA